MSSSKQPLTLRVLSEIPKAIKSPLCISSISESIAIIIRGFADIPGDALIPPSGIEAEEVKKKRKR